MVVLVVDLPSFLPGLHAHFFSIDDFAGTYCPPQDKVDGKDMDTCLGDLYSVNWMEDADTATGLARTLEDDYTYIKKVTNKSHVMQYGTQTFTSTDKRTWIVLTRMNDIAGVCGLLSPTLADDWSLCFFLCLTGVVLLLRSVRWFVCCSVGDYLSEPSSTVDDQTESSSSNVDNNAVDTHDIELVLDFYKYLRSESRGQSVEERDALASQLVERVQTRQAADARFASLPAIVADLQPDFDASDGAYVPVCVSACVSTCLPFFFFLFQFFLLLLLVLFCFSSFFFLAIHIFVIIVRSSGRRLRQGGVQHVPRLLRCLRLVHAEVFTPDRGPLPVLLQRLHRGRHRHFVPRVNILTASGHGVGVRPCTTVPVVTTVIV